MKEFHLKRLNANLRALAIILVMPLLFGVLAMHFAWTDPFFGKTGLILVVLSLLGMITSYFNIYKHYTLKIEDNTLTIRNKKGVKEKKYSLNDIALIQYNESINSIDAFISKNPLQENLLIFSKTGKGIFVCSNSHNQTEFDKFLIEITDRINAKEKIIYSKQIRLTKVYRSLYINPLYENSRIVKKKTRQSGFYFPIIGYLSILIPLIIALNLWSIYGTIPSFLNPSSPKNFKYEGISFQREYYWEFETDEITKGKTYYIGGDSKTQSSFIAITFSKDIYEETPQEYIEYYLDDIKEAEPESEIGEIKTGKFGDYGCVLAHYSYPVEGISYHAVIYAFNTNSKSISIVKQSSRSAGLRHDFKLIEETFKVK